MLLLCDVTVVHQTVGVRILLVRILIVTNNVRNNLTLTHRDVTVSSDVIVALALIESMVTLTGAIKVKVNTRVCVVAQEWRGLGFLCVSIIVIIVVVDVHNNVLGCE
uniref:Uncharacterized protein n=1 Tax=Cacopsylla melanoneura TaxID=428564 RepID=A0A8D9BCP5_9HEMI